MSETIRDHYRFCCGCRVGGGGRPCSRGGRAETAGPDQLALDPPDARRGQTKLISFGTPRPAGPDGRADGKSSDSARRADSISAAHAMPQGPAAGPGRAGSSSYRLTGNHALGRTPDRLPRRAIHLEETCNNEAGAEEGRGSRPADRDPVRFNAALLPGRLSGGRDRRTKMLPAQINDRVD